MMDRETELCAQLAELRHQHATALSVIPALLAVGGDTGPVRRDAAELEHRITATEQQLADLGGAREAEAQEAISAAAAVIAAGTHDAVQARLRVLEPPPRHP
jgi:hypothetical protein